MKSTVFKRRAIRRRGESWTGQLTSGAIPPSLLATGGKVVRESSTTLLVEQTFDRLSLPDGSRGPQGT
ncbi:hypothetical protein, partial [Rugosimonospora africana]|uniref:hypothetical protein n=1 Tax=Rugosimonospora africana TaxID=556532 RepID=UPI0019427687